MVLIMNISLDYFIGTEPCGETLALDKTMATDNIFYPKRFTLYKEIYIGHTPVTRIGENTPVQKRMFGM
jgi:hypothetical protein